MRVTTHLSAHGLFGSWWAIVVSPSPPTLAATMSTSPAVPLARPAQPPRVSRIAALCLSTLTGLAMAQTAPRFDVYEYEIEGNTVLPVAAVERAVTAHLGPERSLGDVEAARAALEKAYQDAGYVTVFVDLPEQEVREGVVRLRVLEGQVSRLKVTESRYYDQGRIRAVVSELAAGKVPNFNVVQAQLAEVNRTEERRVQPILRPGPLPA